MSIEKTLAIGLAGNEISKKITGTSQVSAGRTAEAAGSGAATAGVLTVSAAAVGIASLLD